MMADFDKQVPGKKPSAPNSGSSPKPEAPRSTRGGDRPPSTRQGGRNGEAGNRPNGDPRGDATKPTTDGSRGETPETTSTASDAPGQGKPPSTRAKGADGAKGGSKLPGADATGVDYSDKGMKDRLEHQAADVVMDATPILGQMNQARKSLKKANKAKRDAGIKDGVTDDLERGADKAVDTGIKGAKIATGVSMGSMGGAAGMMALGALKLLAMAKGIAMAVASKALGFLAGAFQMLTTFASTVLGVGAMAAQAIAGGVIAAVMLTATILGSVVVNEVTKKDPGQAMCLPTNTEIDDKVTAVIEDGEANARRQTNAQNLWSIYAALGGNKSQTAAVLGNLHHESGGLDPTAMETISDEPWQIGARKTAAMEADYKIRIVNPAYAARFPAIEYMGIGLAQWTNDRNRLLIKFAENKGVPWHSFETQAAFMLGGDQEYRRKQLTDFVKAKGATVDGATKTFMNTWIGLSGNNPSLGHRVSAAREYMFMLEKMDADIDYGEGILSDLNVDRSAGNVAADAPFQDDGCGNPVNTHYAGDKAADGTGEVPPGLSLVPWTRETLPTEMKKYAVDPSLAGLSWGSSAGWAPNVIGDQCVALASSYFMQLFPSWSLKGSNRPTGNGNTTAFGWASHYGESVTAAPSAGAVFSEALSNPYGHTGIVQHVFANGDILVAEQNISGASGELAGLTWSWSWRVIPKVKYQADSWKFFKPAGEEPRWTKPSA